MLFMAEMPERGKFEIRGQERLSAPDEVDLWCWKEGKMEIVEEIEHKSIAVREETIGAFWKSSGPKRYREIPDGEVHIFPLSNEEGCAQRRGRVVENKSPNVAFAAKTGMQPRLRETYEGLSTFEFGFSEKDEKRVELVRQYIETEGCERVPPKELSKSWWDLGMDISPERSSEASERSLRQDLDLESQKPMVEIPLKSTVQVNVDETSPITTDEAMRERREI